MGNGGALIIMHTMPCSHWPLPSQPYNAATERYVRFSPTWLRDTRRILAASHHPGVHTQHTCNGFIGVVKYCIERAGSYSNYREGLRFGAHA